MYCRQSHQPRRKHLAVHARQMALRPGLQILRRHPRPLPLRLEQAYMRRVKGEQVKGEQLVRATFGAPAVISVSMDEPDFMTRLVTEPDPTYIRSLIETAAPTSRSCSSASGPPHTIIGCLSRAGRGSKAARRVARCHSAACGRWLRCQRAALARLHIPGNESSCNLKA